jgi:hypothetical protein
MSTDFFAIRRRMDATGIGYAGIAGAWWLPAAAPFVLPARLADDLAAAGGAILALLDAVTELYGTPAGAAGGLDALLEHRVPPEIPRAHVPGAVLGLRPDFQLCPLAEPPFYRVVATELEICPSAHGFAHAMQAGYELPADLVGGYARLLAGRELLFVSTAEWSEFLFEQLAFCRALAEVGARGRVLCSLPIAELAASIRRGERWRPPIFGVRERPPGWDDDLLGRLRAGGLDQFLWADDGAWPGQVGDALVFRFGYLENFTAEQIARMCQWQTRGTSFLNPISFTLDSKAVLAALGLPAVRAHIAARTPGALALLDTCIPETLLVTPGTFARLLDERAGWVIKYAGFDRGNQAWGGRSLHVGAQHTPAEWRAALERCLELPWPVVAQPVVPTARVDIAYFDTAGRERWMRGGATRLRSFLVRDPSVPLGPPRAIACGTHLTVSGGALQVSEGTDAVQAPIVFVNEAGES